MHDQVSRASTHTFFIWQVGAIPPMAELQAMWWVQRLNGRVRRSERPPSYGLLGAKLTYGVDYGNYMHQLAAEIGAAPSLSTLARSPRALIGYCLGQAYISYFRLQGPYASATAWTVASTELYEPVARRGAIANLLLLFTCLAFGAMNLAAWALDLALRVVCAPARGLAWVGRRVVGGSGKPSGDVA